MEQTTKKKILDAAEKLYAYQGFAGTSLRAIIKEARVNTAAVHYHFGSKEGLIEAVLEGRAAPINEERLSLLGELESRYQNQILPLEGVLKAFLAPVMRRRFGSGRERELFPRLMGWALTEPDEKVREMMRRLFGEVFVRFGGALMRALPDLSQEDIQLRMHFLVGAMVFTLAVPCVHAPHERELLEESEPERFTRRLVEFVAAGMRAPAREAAGEEQP